MNGTLWIKRISNELLDLVYPPDLYCISCGKIIDDTRTYRLCNECMKAANWITERHCIKCGRPLAQNDPGGLCFSCARRSEAGQRPFFDKGYSCAGYGPVEQAIIFALKYGGQGDIGDTLGEILYDRMISEYEPDELAGMYDIVIPVPAYKEKRLKRGFDQAALIAEAFAKRAGLRNDPGAVIRTKATAPMKGLRFEARRTNVRGVFQIRSSRLGEIPGARILLIDDIFTTGATIDEIASLLKANGASRVDFLAFAGGADVISG